MPSGAQNILPRALVVAIVGVFAVIFFSQASRQYVIDESDFAGVARAIALTGRPIYYRGEDLPHDAGIWHPPLYQYASGAWVWLFGSSHAAFRSFGLFCALSAAAIGWLVLRRLFPERHPWLGVVWVGLFLFNPFLVQSALLPDIDGTVLLPLSMLVVWLATEIVVAHRWRPAKASVLFGLALGLSFLAKLTTPLALVGLAAAALALGYRSWRWVVGGVGLAASIAVVVFGMVWGTIAALANLSFTYPFTFTYDSAVTKSGHPTVVQRLHMLWPIEPVMFWLMPLLVAIVAFSSCVALFYIRRPAAQIVLLCAAFAASVFVVYNEITGPPFGFPKYYAPAIGPALVVAVAPLGLISTRLFRPWGALGRGAVVGVTLLMLGIVVAAYSGYRNAHTHITNRWVWIAVVTCVAALLILRRPSDSVLAAAGVATAGALVVLSAVSLIESASQSHQKRNVRYFPGEFGEAQTVDEVRRLLGAKGRLRAQLLSPKDVGYESGMRYYEDALYLGRPRVLAQLIARTPDLLVVTRSHFDYSEPIFPQAFSVIRRSAHPVWISPGGYFTLWKRNSRTE